VPPVPRTEPLPAVTGVLEEDAQALAGYVALARQAIAALPEPDARDAPSSPAAGRATR